MLNTLRWVVWLFAYMAVRLPLYWRTLWLGRHGREAEKSAIVEHQVQRWARVLLKHIKMDVEIVGRENLPGGDEVVVYAANHQSYLDIPVLLANLAPPHPLIARRGIGQVPMLGGWMRQLGCVFIDRDDARANVAAMRRADEVLQSGRAMIVFPEGTRSQSDAVGPFLPGAVRIAWKAGVPVVPIAISGTFRGMEGGGMRIKPARVTVHVLPPVDTEGLDKAGQRALPERLREMIVEANAASE